MAETGALLISRANAAQTLLKGRAEQFVAAYSEPTPDLFDTAMLVYGETVYDELLESEYLATYIDVWGLEESLAFALLYAKISPELALAFEEDELFNIPGVGEEEFVVLVEARKRINEGTSEDDGE